VSSEGTVDTLGC